MAAINDLADLFVATTEYVGRSDFAHLFPRFVALAEDRLSRLLRTEGQEKLVTLVADSEGKSALPSDFREALAVKTVNGVSLSGGDLRTLDALYPYSGEARAFAISGGYLWLRPASASSVSLIYQATLPRLSASVPSHASLQRFSSLYLLAVAREVYLWARDADAVALADRALGQALAEVMQDEERRRMALARPRLNGVTP